MKGHKYVDCLVLSQVSLNLGEYKLCIWLVECTRSSIICIVYTFELDNIQGVGEACSICVAIIILAQHDAGMVYVCNQCS